MVLISSSAGSNDDSKFLGVLRKEHGESRRGRHGIEGEKIASSGDGTHGQGLHTIDEDFVFYCIVLDKEKWRLR